MVNAGAGRRTMMKLSVSLKALGTCCLVAVWTLPAQDTPPKTAEPGVTVLTTFPGDTGPGPKDAPDNSGAVGPDHVVDFTNANVVIHDKKTGSDPANDPDRILEEHQARLRFPQAE